MDSTKRRTNTLDGQEIFESRGLDPEVMARLGVTVRNGKIGFPYRSGNGAKFWKIRPVREKKYWIEPAGSVLSPWLLDRLQDLPCRPEEPLVWAEGEWDASAIIQACGGYVTSVPNGGNGRRTQAGTTIADDKAFAYLWGKDGKLIPEIDQFRKFILAVDNDETGTILRDELAIRLGAARCWFVEWPEGCKDANEVLLKYGEEVLRECIYAAKPMCPGHIVSIMDIPPNQFIQTFNTGWGYLDKHLKLKRPSIVVVTGIPNHGKGQWTRSLAFHLALEHGMRTTFFAPEDASSRIQADALNFAQRYAVDGADKKEEAAKDWAGRHIFLSSFPDEEAATLDAVDYEMEVAALQKDCQVFVIDPWNEIEHDYGRLTEGQYIEKTLRRWRRTVKRLGIILIIVAHPTKLDERSPSLYTISGSANWKNKCDHGIIIERFAEDNKKLTDEGSVWIEKSKDHELMGVPGKVFVRFNRDICDFSQSLPRDEIKYSTKA